MTKFHRMMPLAMGAGMGLMMLWMIHGTLTGDSQMGATALAVFIGAHVAVLIVAAMLMWWAARFAPRLQTRLSRLHRPSLRHVAQMMAAAATAMALAHLYLHGGL